MSWFYQNGDAKVEILDTREVVHHSSGRFHLGDYGAMEMIEQRNELRKLLCPYIVGPLNHQTEHADVYFDFIKENTTGKWYRTAGVIFHFERETDAFAFKMRWT